MTETTTGEQIDVWKRELTIATADRQWRLALKLCSWLRYALWQQGLSDPQVEEVHRQAKEALAREVTLEKTRQEREERHRQLRRKIMYRIISGDWDRALDSVEALHRDGADRQETIHLLQELKVRQATRLAPEYRQMNQRAAALGRRFDELVERVGGDSPVNGN